MDLSEFELTDEPVFIQLEHFKTGALLFETKKEKDEEGNQFEVDDPDKPVGVLIYGADSEVFKKHLRRAANRGLEIRFNKSEGRDNKNKPPVSAEEIESETQKSLAACIAGFVRVEWKGQKLEAPKDNLMFVKRMPWAVEQIDKAMADRSRFMPALKKV